MRRRGFLGCVAALAALPLYKESQVAEAATAADFVGPLEPLPDPPITVDGFAELLREAYSRERVFAARNAEAYSKWAITFRRDRE